MGEQQDGRHAASGSDDDATAPQEPVSEDESVADGTAVDGTPAEGEPPAPGEDAEATQIHDASTGWDDTSAGEQENGSYDEAGYWRERTDPDATAMLPPSSAETAAAGAGATATSPAWAGRAGVPLPPSERLRDSAPYSTSELPPPPSRTWWTPVLLGLLALGLVGIVVLVAYFMSRDNKPEPQTTATATLIQPTTAGPVPTTEAPTAQPSPTVQLVQIPTNIATLSQQQATAELDRLGLAYQFVFEFSNEPQGNIITTRPAPGELVPARSTVVLVISRGPEPTPAKTTATPTPTASS